MHKPSTEFARLRRRNAQLQNALVRVGLRLCALPEYGRRHHAIQKIVQSALRKNK
jgi:hypothetical protein